jgi:exonuclease VII large subunit
MHLAAAFEAAVDRRKDELKNLERRLNRASPLRRIQDRRQRMDELEEDMQRAFSIPFNGAAPPYTACRCACTASTRAPSCGAAMPLSAGQTDGRLVDSVQQVQPGMPLDITVSDGHFQARAEDNSNADRILLPIECFVSVISRIMRTENDR